MKQPTTRQLINEANKIERQMNEINQLGELNPNKEYKRTPSKGTRNKQALKGLQTRANKMGIKLPQFNNYSTSERVQLQKQYLNKQLQNKLNNVNNQINDKPLPKTIQVMGKRMKTDGMTYKQIDNLKRQVNDYRKSLKAVEKKMREQGFDEELINALMSGKERFKISSSRSNDIYGSFDNLGLAQVNVKNYKSAKDFYDDLSMILGSDLNPSNFNNRLIERTDIVNSIRSVVDNYSSDITIEDELKKLQNEVESMNGMQLFMFGSTVDIETFVKDLDKYLKNNSDDYAKSKNYIMGQTNRIRRFKSTNTSFTYYN